MLNVVRVIVALVVILQVYMLGLHNGEIGALKKCYAVYKKEVPWNCS